MTFNRSGVLAKDMITLPLAASVIAFIIPSPVGVVKLAIRRDFGGSLLLVIALIATAQVWARPLASPTGTPGPSATTVNSGCGAINSSAIARPLESETSGWAG